VSGLPRLTAALLAAVVVFIVVAPVAHLAFSAFGAPEVLAAVLSDAGAWRLLGRSVLLAAVVSVSAMVLGTALAWFTVRAAWPTWLRLVATVLLGSALAVPSYVVAFGLIAAAAPGGVLAPLLPEGTHARQFPLVSAWIVLTSCTFPYVLLSARSALARECGSLEEAALSVGASRLRAFFRIVLPRAMPNVLWGGMLAGLYCLADFGAVALLGYETLTWGIYSRYDTAFGLDEARGLSLMLAALTLTMVALMRLVRPGLAPAPASVPLCQSPVRLGVWNVPAMALMAAPVCIGVALPVIAVLGWLTRSDEPMEAIRAMAGPAGGTIRLASVAAIAVPALALPIAALHLRGGGGGDRAARAARAFGGLITPLTLLGFALPGVGSLSRQIRGWRPRCAFRWRTGSTSRKSSCCWRTRCCFCPKRWDRCAAARRASIRSSSTPPLSLAGGRSWTCSESPCRKWRRDLPLARRWCSSPRRRNCRRR
jgi:iron(III) transport system permease protein